MKKKSLLCYLFAAALVACSLTSCGGSDDDNSPENTQPSGSTTGGSTTGGSTTGGGTSGGSTTPEPVKRNPYVSEVTTAGTWPAAEITLDNAVSPAEVCAAMGMGWNLGNHFDAHNNGVSAEDAWIKGQKCTQATMNAIAAAGVKTVRIPVTWMGHIGAAPDYKLEEAWLNRVAEVVGYCENAGLNAIVNIHHDGADAKFWLNIKQCGSNTAIQKKTVEQLSKMWTQIAEKFKDKGNFLIFECLNEIQDGKWGWGDNRNDGGKQYKALNEWLQTIVDAIRATGGKNATRWIGIPAYNTDIDLCEHLVLPEDPAKRLMVAVHYYAPYKYTLEVQYSKWGQKAPNQKDPESGDEGACRTQMKKMYDRYVSKGIPAYVGEMGNCNRGNDIENNYRAYYFEYVAKCMNNNLLAPVLWDNGVADKNKDGSYKECHGYFNHGTGAWMNSSSERMINVLVKAVTDRSADYTLESIAAKAPSN